MTQDEIGVLFLVVSIFMFIFLMCGFLFAVAGFTGELDSSWSAMMEIHRQWREEDAKEKEPFVPGKITERVSSGLNRQQRKERREEILKNSC